MSIHPMPQAVLFATFAVGLASIAGRLSSPAMFTAGLPSIDFAALAATLGAVAAALMAAAKALESLSGFLKTLQASRAETLAPPPPEGNTICRLCGSTKPADGPCYRCGR